MNVNDSKNINSNNVNFNGINQGKVVLTPEERMQKLVEACKQNILENAKNRVPETHKFAPVGIEFRLPDTQYVGRMAITYDEEDYKTQRRLIYGVRHQNSDRLYSNYMAKGTKQEIIDYLNRPEANEEIISTVNELAKQADEHYSTL